MCELVESDQHTHTHTHRGSPMQGDSEGDTDADGTSNSSSSSGGGGGGGGWVNTFVNEEGFVRSFVASSRAGGESTDQELRSAPSSVPCLSPCTRALVIPAHTIKQVHVCTCACVPWWDFIMKLGPDARSVQVAALIMT